MPNLLRDRRTLTLEAAKRVAAAAEAEAAKNKWSVVIAVVDEGGHLIYLQRQDGAQYGSVEVAWKKAQTAIAFRRPTKVWDDATANGRTAVLGLPILPLEGGLPLIVDGEMIGAIGVSGVIAHQDGVVAHAGAQALAGIA